MKVGARGLCSVSWDDFRQAAWKHLSGTMSGDKRGKKPIACSHYLGLGRLSGQVSRWEPLGLTVA